MLELGNPKGLQKILLAKKVGQFLSSTPKPSERRAVEDVARTLAEDISYHVRSTLAYALRNTRKLPADVAERIACDVEDIASTFLAETNVFTDENLARIIPKMQEKARLVVARRKDLGELTAVAIAQSAGEQSVTHLVQNLDVRLREEGSKSVATRFLMNQPLMNDLAAREDVPLSVVKHIIDHVSHECKHGLVERFGVAPKIAEHVTGIARADSLWDKLRAGSRQQIHALAVDLRADDRLQWEDVVEMAERGCLPFLESALAICSGSTVSEIRAILKLTDKNDFVKLVRNIDMSESIGPRILRLAKAKYAL